MTDDNHINALLQSAEAGDTHVYSKLGHIYATGDAAHNIAPDLEKAGEYYARGAEKGDMASTFGLAGITLHDNPLKALSLLETCAEHKYLWALATLGDFYLRGRYVEKNPKKAFAYLQAYNELCAPDKVPPQVFKVRWDLVLYPICLMLGVGCEKNEEKALAVLGDLASRGNLSAADILHTGKLNDWMAAKRFNIDTLQNGPLALFDATGQGAAQNRGFSDPLRPRVHRHYKDTIHQQHLSKFLQRALIPNEEILMRAKFPRIYMVDSFLQLIFFLLLGRWLEHLAAIHAEDIYPLLPVPVFVWLFKYPQLPVLILGAFGVFNFFRRMIKEWTTELVLTNGRLIYKRGLFFIEMIQMNFWQIEHSDVTQSLLGHFLDYGRVHIQSYAMQKQESHTGGAGMLVLPNISHPYLFSRLIEDNRQLPFKNKVRGGQPIPMWGAQQ